MIAGPWKNVAAFEAWWRVNVMAFNRLAVTDPAEWEKVAAAVEALQARRRRMEALDV